MIFTLYKRLIFAEFLQDIQVPQLDSGECFMIAELQSYQDYCDHRASHQDSCDHRASFIKTIVIAELNLIKTIVIAELSLIETIGIAELRLVNILLGSLSQSYQDYTVIAELSLIKTIFSYFINLKVKTDLRSS